MKARLITAFTIIIVVPMLIISMIITLRITDILNKDTHDKLSYTLFAMSKLIYEDVEKIKNKLETLKYDPNMIDGVLFKDEKKFGGLLESAKKDLKLTEAIVYSWKDDMATTDKDGHFYVIEQKVKDKDKSESDKIKRSLIYIEEAILKDGEKIIGVVRFQKNFDDAYLKDKASNFTRLAPVKVALFNGETSLASTYGTVINLKNEPKNLANIDLIVNNIPYQAKLARITSTIINEENDSLHLLVALSKEEANKTLNGIIFLIVVVASISTIIAIFIGFLVARWLADRMNRTVMVVDRIAGGDLTEVIEKQKKSLIFRKDEMARVLESVGVMSEELINIVMETMKSVEVAVEVAKELNDSNELLSQRAEVQASSIEEISATLEQMTSTIKSTADNSKKVRDLVEDTHTKIKRGETIIAEAITAMNLISDSSTKIANITNVVDDIAFQTNLLSLNASVEAARAGEQGKGFAVVANEVRNLAQLSTNAVNDIKRLIEDTGERVEKGSKLVNDSGEILEEIVESMDKVSSSMQEVADASSEQEIGIAHVNEAVQQIDSMIQKNTVLADRTMILSNKMTNLAGELQSLMSFFKVNNYEYQTSAFQNTDESEYDQFSDDELFRGETSPYDLMEEHEEEAIKPDKITTAGEEEDDEKESPEYEEMNEDDLYSSDKGSEPSGEAQTDKGKTSSNDNDDDENNEGIFI